MKKSITKTEKIRKTPEFRALYQSGSSVNRWGMKLFYASNDLGYCRFGISLTRQYGNAVTRNKAKRRMREIIRLHKHLYKPNYDILVLIFQSQVEYQERERQYLSLCKKAQLLLPTH